MPADRTCAVIGLGAMGAALAARLVERGWQVRVFDVELERMHAATAFGGVPALSAEDAFASSKFVIVLVATGDQLERVVLGDVIRAGQLVLAMSTVGPEAIRAIASQLSDPAQLLDVPVTGGPDRARAGSLVVMAGGAAETLALAQPLLQDIATHVVPCGEVGDGQAVKLVNQLLVGVHIVAAAEALAYAQALGIDQRLAFDVLTRGAAASFMLEDRGPRMIDGAFVPPRTGLDIFVKDLKLVLDAARRASFDGRLAEVAAEAFDDAAAAATDRVDDAAVIDVYRHPR
jgi:3-hydroxyisobutyrate dehydrogenase-like beta-hydroxyacid dehydrogenase